MRISPRNYKLCYVHFPDEYTDIYVPWRNRALNGDIVAVQLLANELYRVVIEDVQRFIEQKGLDQTICESTLSKASPGQYVAVLGARSIVVSGSWDLGACS